MSGLGKYWDKEVYDRSDHSVVVLVILVGLRGSFGCALGFGSLGHTAMASGGMLSHQEPVVSALLFLGSRRHLVLEAKGFILGIVRRDYGALVVFF